MKRTIETPGLILRTTPYGEADLIGSLLTPDRGKISFIAKGSRKSCKRFPGGLDPMGLATFQLIEPRNNSSLFVAENCSLHQALPAFHNSLSKFTHACLAVEIADALSTPLAELHPQTFFNLTLDWLTDIADAESSTQLTASCAAHINSLLRLAGIDPLSNPEFMHQIANFPPPPSPSPEQEEESGVIMENNNQKFFILLLDYLETYLGKKLRSRDSLSLN